MTFSNRREEPPGFHIVLFRCFLLLSCTFSTTACPSSATNPQHVVSEYYKSVKRGAWEEARSFQTKDHTGESSPEERTGPLPALPPLGEAHIFWELDTANGTVTLERSSHGETISRGVLTYFDRTSPIQAVRAFASALRHERADIMIHLVPSEQGPIGEEEMKSLFKKNPFADLRLHWSTLSENHPEHRLVDKRENQSIVQSGTHTFWLVQEEDGWKIKDIREGRWP